MNSKKKFINAKQAGSAKYINYDIENGVLYMRCGINNIIDDVINNGSAYSFKNIPYSLIKEYINLRNYYNDFNLSSNGDYTSIIRDRLNNDLVLIKGNLINGTAEFKNLLP